MAGPNAADNRAQAAIAERLAAAGFALPGSLVERTMVCGKPGCRCTADPPRLHGPYNQWTRKIDGRTVTRRLDDEQMERYGAWFVAADHRNSPLSITEIPQWSERRGGPDVSLRSCQVITSGSTSSGSCERR
jgi:hypothetical protein